jgi:hypothetical protein
MDEVISCYGNSGPPHGASPGGRSTCFRPRPEAVLDAQTVAATMLFNSYQFIFGFLPTVCIAYFVAVRFWGRRAGMAVLVAGSLFFYGWWNERYLWILLLSIGCNAGFALALIRGEKQQRFWILLLGLGTAGGPWACR